MSYHMKTGSPVNMPDPVKLEVCRELITFVEAGPRANATIYTCLEAVSCILKDDATVCCASPRSEFVHLLKKHKPRLWEIVRPFLRANDLKCSECGHYSYWHPDMNTPDSPQAQAGHCFGSDGNGTQGCPCKTFIPRLL